MQNGYELVMGDKANAAHQSSSLGCGPDHKTMLSFTLPTTLGFELLLKGPCSVAVCAPGAQFSKKKKKKGRRFEATR